MRRFIIYILGGLFVITTPTTSWVSTTECQHLARFYRETIVVPLFGTLCRRYVGSLLSCHKLCWVNLFYFIFLLGVIDSVGSCLVVLCYLRIGYLYFKFVTTYARLHNGNKVTRWKNSVDGTLLISCLISRTSLFISRPNNLSFLKPHTKRSNCIIFKIYLFFFCSVTLSRPAVLSVIIFFRMEDYWR